MEQTQERIAAMQAICAGMTLEEMQNAPFTYQSLLEIVQRRDVRNVCVPDERMRIGSTFSSVLAHSYPAPAMALDGEKLGVTRTESDFDFCGESQVHIPKLTLYFEAVPVGEANDSKGWADRDAAFIFLAEQN